VLDRSHEQPHLGARPHLACLAVAQLLGYRPRMPFARVSYLSLLTASLAAACSQTTKNNVVDDGSGGAAGEGPSIVSTASDTTASNGGTSFTAAADNGGPTSDGTSSSGAPDSTASSGGSAGAGATTSTPSSGGATSNGDAGGGSGGNGTAASGGSSPSSDTTSSSGGSGAAGGTSACPSGACSLDCPCETGEAECSGDSECAPGLVCTAAAIAKLGFTSGAKSCMPAHCDNDQVDTDEGETSQDCGGECGCRATYEEVAFTGLPSDVETVDLSSLSGNATVLVGSVRYSSGSPNTVPIFVSATSGAVTFLPNHGVDGYAQFVSDDGSIIAGTLNCAAPPDCTGGSQIPFRWVDGATPIKYPFNNTLSGMSASGNVVVFTSDDVYASRWVLSTGDTTSATELNWVHGVSGDGRVAYSTLAIDDNRDALWFSQTGEVVTPPYPAAWGAGFVYSVDADGSVFVGFGIEWLDETTVVRYPYISRDGAIEVLDVPEGMQTVIPRKLSADGSRFVGEHLNPDSTLIEALLWDDAGGLRSLYDELMARGLELPIDTELPRAEMLSSNGRVIVLEAANLAPFTRIELLD